MARDILLSGLQSKALTVNSPAVAARIFAALVTLSVMAITAFAESDLSPTWRAAGVTAFAVSGVLGSILGTAGWLLARQIRLTELQLHSSNNDLLRSAMEDSLTGIGNRRLFDDALRREHRRAARTEMPLALLLLDVDYFKAYNDTYGHPAGDACLRRVAAAIAHQAQRPADLAARYGGEEFAMLLPETETAGAVAIAERAREAVRQLALEHVGGLDGIVSISIGVAVIWPQPADGDPEDLVRFADTALYTAKAQGRDQACLFPDKPPASLLEDVAAWVIPPAPPARSS